MPKVYTVA